MLRNLFVRLWNDGSGAVIATEYLMLGSIVALGGAAGMAEMRDSMIDQYRELGQSIRETRQSYSVPAHRGGSARTGGGGEQQSRPPDAPDRPERRDLLSGTMIADSTASRWHRIVQIDQPRPVQRRRSGRLRNP